MSPNSKDFVDESSRSNDYGNNSISGTTVIILIKLETQEEAFLSSL